MFVSRGKNFIIPVTYVNGRELDFYGFHFDTKEIVIITPEMKGNIQNKIQYLYFKLKDLAAMVPASYEYNLYESVFKSILMAHVNNIPCFGVVKEKPINGMNAQQVVEMHLAKFKELYDFHVNEYECNDTESKRGRVLENDALQVKLQGLNNEVDLMFKQMATTASKVSIEEVLSMHLLIMETFMALLINNVPCFSKAKNGVNGTTLEEVQEMHKRKFTEIFNMHVNSLNCK